MEELEKGTWRLAPSDGSDHHTGGGPACLCSTGRRARKARGYPIVSPATGTRTSDVPVVSNPSSTIKWTISQVPGGAAPEKDDVTPVRTGPTRVAVFASPRNGPRSG